MADLLELLDKLQHALSENTEQQVKLFGPVQNKLQSLAGGDRTILEGGGNNLPVQWGQQGKQGLPVPANSSIDQDVIKHIGQQLQQALNTQLASGSGGNTRINVRGGGGGGERDCCDELLDSFRHLINYVALILDRLNQFEGAGTGGGGGPPPPKEKKEKEADWKGLKGGLDQLITSNRLEGMGSGASSMLKNLGEHLPGNAGKAVEMVGKLGETAFGTLGKLRQWGDQLHLSNIQFAEWSGQMKRVEIGAEIRQMKMSRERGERLAPSAKLLAEARDDLSKTLIGPETKVKSLFNNVIADMTDTIGQVFKGNFLFTWEDLRKMQEQRGQEELSAQREILQVGQEAWPEKFQRPARFNP